MKGDSKKTEWIAETYDLFHLDVYRFLLSFTGSKSDAEDLTQETFMQLLKSSESIMNKENPKTWILKVAKYKAIDYHRKRKFTTLLKDKIIKEIPSEDLSPGGTLLENETEKELMECISSLKPSFKLVVILRGINELSTAETASVLKCSESKVKTTYHRALKQLKSKLTIQSKGGISLKMSDDFKSKISELKNSEQMRPNTEFVNRTRQKLIDHNLRSPHKKTTKIFPVFSMLILFSISILLLIPFDLSKLTTSGYYALEPIGFQIKDQTDVYIYHTHSNEYLLPIIGNNIPKYPPSKNDDTVKDVGTYLTMYLDDLDVSVTHDTTDFVKRAENNGDSFSELYKHSRKNLVKFINETESSKNTLLIDLHLDSQKRKYTTTSINGKDTARIVFIISTQNPNYESNLKFAKNLNRLLEHEYPGISRGVMIKEQGKTASTYNQDLSPKALLINVGGIENTLEEEKRATKILAEVLKSELE